MSKTILVTGAAGFIGSHVAQALLARGDTVVGLDNLNDYYDPARKRANLSEFEIRNKVEGARERGSRGAEGQGSGGAEERGSGGAEGPGRIHLSTSAPLLKMDMLPILVR